MLRAPWWWPSESCVHSSIRPEKHFQRGNDDSRSRNVEHSKGSAGVKWRRKCFHDFTRKSQTKMCHRHAICSVLSDHKMGPTLTHRAFKGQCFFSSSSCHDLANKQTRSSHKHYASAAKKQTKGKDVKIALALIES